MRKGIDKSYLQVYNAVCKGKGVFELQAQRRFSLQYVKFNMVKKAKTSFVRVRTGDVLFLIKRRFA